MEILILLFLLSSNGGNADLKKTLNDFLCFYRENRELFQLLLSKPALNAPEQTQQKNRPQSEEVGSYDDILSEFLKRSNA